MSDFDPGPGWHKTDNIMDAKLIEYDEQDDIKYMWAPQESVPPLPTEPYTVILTKGKLGLSDWVMVWYGNEWHQTATGRGISASELRTLITGFEVLAEPRAVTAKAVLDELADIADYEPEKWQEVGRKFGAPDV